MRLIDADVLEKNLDKEFKKVKDPLYAIDIALEKTPTIDAVPVVRGKWTLHDNGDGTCDQCHCYQKHIWDYDNWQNFCGHCGADMRGE